METARNQILMGIRHYLVNEALPRLEDEELKSMIGMACDLLGQSVLSLTTQANQPYETAFAALADNKTSAPLMALTQQEADLHNRFQAATAPKPDANPKAQIKARDMQAYLRAEVDGFDEAVVENVSRIPGGFSKDTFLIELTEGSAPHARLVMRRDLPAGPGETQVANEYACLQPLYTRSFPIAEPIKLETNTDHFAEPFLLNGWVSGDADQEAWKHDPAQKQSVGTHLAEILAELHTTDPASLGVSRHEGLSAQDAVRAELEHWHDMWQRRHWVASPTLTAAFEWLLNNVPASISHTGVVHADVGFHNTIIGDGKILALLDWEFTHAGDPSEDLAYCRQYVEPVMPWDDFLGAYHAAGGPPYQPDTAPFYELWRHARNAVCCAVAMEGFVRGESHDIRMAFEGTTLYRVFLSMTRAHLMMVGGLTAEGN
ncbi:MAG: phosphotransferase family protein [Alphaproteobacteria bacterium]